MLNGAAHERHELGAQRFAAKVCFAGDIRSEDRLNETAAVAEIDEDHPAVIATAVYPAGHHHFTTDERGDHLATMVAAAKGSHPVELHLELYRGLAHCGLFPKTSGKTRRWLAEVARVSKREGTQESSVAEQMRLRPFDLARYMALSAASSSASRVRPWVG